MPIVHRVKLIRDDETLSIGVHQGTADASRAVSTVLVKYKTDGWRVDTVDSAKVATCRKCDKLIDLENSMRLSNRVAYCGSCFLVRSQEMEELAAELCDSVA